jgi:hypothetical protein
MTEAASDLSGDVVVVDAQALGGRTDSTTVGEEGAIGFDGEPVDPPQASCLALLWCS